MQLTTSVENIFNQLKEALNQISEDDYVKPLDVLSGSSIGQHIRHMLEFFICLNDGAKNGVINYDKRKRDKAIEGSKAVCLSVIEKILLDIKEEDKPEKLILEGDYSGGNGEGCFRINSCFDRELAYNVEHSIHHMALIKIGLRAVSDKVEIPKSFGVASSTIRHEEKTEVK